MLMTESQVEQLAAELIALPVPELLAEIDQRIAAVLGDADPNIARAANCPVGTSAVVWLEELGLIERDNAGGYVKTPKATARVVRPRRQSAGAALANQVGSFERNTLANRFRFEIKTRGR
jgi:hypothetical protein